jgi:hypothetical protein
LLVGLRKSLNDETLGKRVSFGSSLGAGPVANGDNPSCS